MLALPLRQLPLTTSTCTGAPRRSIPTSRVLLGRISVVPSARPGSRLTAIRAAQKRDRSLSAAPPPAAGGSSAPASACRLAMSGQGALLRAGERPRQRQTMRSTASGKAGTRCPLHLHAAPAQRQAELHQEQLLERRACAAARRPALPRASSAATSPGSCASRSASANASSRLRRRTGAGRTSSTKPTYSPPPRFSMARTSAAEGPPRRCRRDDRPNESSSRGAAGSPSAPRSSTSGYASPCRRPVALAHLAGDEHFAK